jgi:hypothetical protein
MLAAWPAGILRGCLKTGARYGEATGWSRREERLASHLRSVSSRLHVPLSTGRAERKSLTSTRAGIAEAGRCWAQVFLPHCCDRGRDRSH